MYKFNSCSAVKAEFVFWILSPTLSNLAHVVDILTKEDAHLLLLSGQGSVQGQNIFKSYSLESRMGICDSKAAVTPINSVEVSAFSKSDETGCQGVL